MFKNPLLPLWYLLIQYLQKASIPSPGAAPKSSGSVCGTSTREARASCWSVHIFLESFPDGNHLTAPFPPLLSIPLVSSVKKARALALPKVPTPPGKKHHLSFHPIFFFTCIYSLAFS
jgi:hypothetical protein